MYIEEREGHTRIFPFVDNLEEAPFSQNISIYEKGVVFNGSLYSVISMHKLIAAFQEALRLMGEEVFNGAHI